MPTYVKFLNREEFLSNPDHYLYDYSKWIRIGRKSDYVDFCIRRRIPAAGTPAGDNPRNSAGSFVTEAAYLALGYMKFDNENLDNVAMDGDAYALDTGEYNPLRSSQTRQVELILNTRTSVFMHPYPEKVPGLKLEMILLHLPAI